MCFVENTVRIDLFPAAEWPTVRSIRADPCLLDHAILNPDHERRASTHSGEGGGMPRFFFDIYDGRSIEDATGHDFDDRAAARRELQRLLGELTTHKRPDKPAFQIRVDVRSERGGPVIMAGLSFIIEESID